MSLRDLTKEDHDRAEQQPFVKIMFSGNLNPETYAVFLWNQYMQYKILEDVADSVGALDSFPAIHRADKLKEDFEELWEKDIKAGPILDVTREFNEYIQEIGKADDAKKRLFAHCYTRHMGDMMGGQILAKMVPGSGKLYQFPDKLELQGKIRAKLTDDLVSEVKVAYKFAQKTFEQMMPYVKQE